MSSSPLPAAKTRSRLFLRCLVLAGLCLATAGVVYLMSTPTRTTEADDAQRLAEHFNRYGPRTELDPKRYTDKDGDLVADLPEKPADRINPPKLIFTGITLDDPRKASAVWKPLVEHLSKEVGRPVEYDTALRKVEPQLTALRDGKLHVTAFSTGSVPPAVNSAGFVPVCVPAHENGTFAYQMEIIVPAGSPAQTVTDLKGRQLTFSTLSSNAGLKAPMYLLSEEHGMYPGRDYTFNLSGGYVQSLRGIASGQYEAASVANDVLRREVARGTIKKEQYRTIYTSGNFPPMCFGHAHNLDPELAGKVRKALLGFSWAGTSVEAEYGPAGLKKFMPVDYKKDWELVRTIDQGMVRLAGGGKP